AGDGQRGAPPRLLSSCSISDDVADDDRQWHMRKPWYAGAVADLAAQALRAGVSGVIYRALDDAIQPRSLWGLWDSTGAYDRDGEPRPIARAWTILSRCFPPGARTVDVEHEARSGFRAVGALVRRDVGRLDEWSVLLVNRRAEPLDLLLQF